MVIESKAMMSCMYFLNLINPLVSTLISSNSWNFLHILVGGTKLQFT